MLNYNNFILVESFDISQNKPERLTPTKAKELLKEYLDNKYNNSNNIVDEIFSSYDKLYLFKYNEDNENYIVFFGKEKNSKYFEIHFNNIKHVDNFLNINVLKSSQKLLSFLFSIIYYYGLKKSEDIIIVSDKDNDRSKLYKKIAEKLIKKYKLNYNVLEGTNSIILKYLTNSKILFTERFI